MTFSTWNRCHMKLEPGIPRDESPLDGSVHRVVLMSSGEKMAGVNAESNIALMANQKPIWNLPEVKSPRKAMRDVAFLDTVLREMAVTVRNSSSRPNPARTKFRPVGWYWAILIHLAPKGLLKRFLSSIWSGSDLLLWHMKFAFRMLLPGWLVPNRVPYYVPTG